MDLEPRDALLRHPRPPPNFGAPSTTQGRSVTPELCQVPATRPGWEARIGPPSAVPVPTLPDEARAGGSLHPLPPPELASVVCERSEVRSARRSRPRPLRAPAAAGGTEGGPQCVWPGPFYFPPITHASARAFLPEIEGTTPTGQLGGAAPVHPHGATCRATTREAGTRTFPVGTCTASPPTPPRRSPREGWTWWTSRSWRRRAPRLPSAAASRAPRSRSATAPTAGTTPSAATTRAR